MMLFKVASITTITHEGKIYLHTNEISLLKADEYENQETSLQNVL